MCLYPIEFSWNFSFLLPDADGPVPLELPDQWLWDIVDEFIYQVGQTLDL